jgi:hypothetical protein
VGQNVGITGKYKPSLQHVPIKARVLELFEIDVEQGIAYHKPRKEVNSITKAWNAKFAGKRAGSTNVCSYGDAYVRVAFDGQTHGLEEIIWCVHTGAWPQFTLDHKDGNKRNNKIENLRPATLGQNRANSKKRTDNSTGYIGVIFRKRRQQYVALVKKNGQVFTGGSYTTAIDAARARDKLAVELWGEYARLNF